MHAVAVAALHAVPSPASLLMERLLQKGEKFFDTSDRPIVLILSSFLSYRFGESNRFT